MMRGASLPGIAARRNWSLFVHCFLDDSGKDSSSQNPYVVLASYFAESNVWIELCDRWVALLIKHQISMIHMKDIIPLEGEYRKLGWDLQKRDAILSEFIDAIRRAPVIGVAVAMEMAAWRKIKNAHPDVKLGTAQEFCFQRIMRRIIDRLAAARLEGGARIMLIFDRDPEFSSSRINIFNWIIKHDPRARKSLVSVTFADPTYYPGIQCADLLAWETRKECVQKGSGHKSTKRWQHLFEKMPGYHLDYMGEFWDEAEWNKCLPQIIEDFSCGVGPTVPSEAWKV